METTAAAVLTLFPSPLFVFVHISLPPAVTGGCNKGRLRQRMSEQTAVDPVAGLPEAYLTETK